MQTAEKTCPDNIDGLLLRLAAGDKTALGQLYEAVSPPVYYYALSVLKNREEAEDIIHDAIIEIWRSAPGYKSEGKPMAWIMTVTRRLCLKQMQRRRLKEEQEDIAELAACAGLTDEDRVVIRALLEVLRDDEREIVMMHAVSGLRHREIAAVTGRPLSTVLSRYQRALAKLRNALSDAPERRKYEQNRKDDK